MTRAALPFAPAEPTVAISIATGSIKPLAAAFGPTPRLDMEQHAQLHAELTAMPEQAAQIRERYGLTLEAQKDEDEFWHTELSRNPATRATWLRARAAARMNPPKKEKAK